MVAERISLKAWRSVCERVRHHVANAPDPDSVKDALSLIDSDLPPTSFPFVVLFSVFFWTYFWGLFGAFIGVPITIALITYCAQHPSSAWLAELLGAPEDQPKKQPAPAS